MLKYIIIFFVSLIFGFSVLIFRNYYEKNTGEIKSHWNISHLDEGDSKNFFDRAIALSSGKHYYSGCENAPVVAFFRPPLYPVFLALTFAVFGVSLKAVIIIQIIIASFIVLLISIISKILFNDFVSLISGILATLYYPMWNNAMIINSELLSMFFGLLALFFICKYYYSQDKLLLNLLTCGILVGLASLTRGQFFFYSLLLVLFIFKISENNFLKNVKLASVWLTFVLIPIIIWSLYAYLSAGIFIFISSQGALSIWWGWSPLVVLEQKYPVWNPLWDTSFIKDDMIGFYLPVKSSIWFISEAVNFILKYPLDSMKIAYFKVLDCWGFIEIYSNNSFATKLIKIFKFNWDFILAICGWVLLWKNKESKIFSLYTIYACLMFTLISLMTAGLIRYRIPYLDPLFIIIASYFVYRIYIFFNSKKLNTN